MQRIKRFYCIPVILYLQELLVYFPVPPVKGVTVTNSGLEPSLLLSVFMALGYYFIFQIVDFQVVDFQKKLIEKVKVEVMGEF